MISVDAAHPGCHDVEQENTIPNGKRDLSSSYLLGFLFFPGVFFSKLVTDFNRKKHLSISAIYALFLNIQTYHTHGVNCLKFFDQKLRNLSYRWIK